MTVFGVPLSECDSMALIVVEKVDRSDMLSTAIQYCREDQEKMKEECTVAEGKRAAAARM